MPLKDFNANVKYNGKTVRLFTRQTQIRTPDWVWLNLRDDGFEGIRRIHQPKVHYDDYFGRSYRTSRTYYDYAKDLCKNYTADRDRHLLCKEHNRYILPYSHSANLTGWEVFCFAMLDFCKRGRLENT